MANISQEVKDTLDSPGARHIVRALRSFHKSQWRKLRTCSPDELAGIQAVMKAIDEALPVIVESLMNKNLDPKKDKEPGLWFKVTDWLKRIR
jgi:hypothetical protein